MSNSSNIIGGVDTNALLDIIQIAVRNEMETLLKDNRFGTEFIDDVWDRNQVARFLGITPEKVSYCFKKKEIPGTKVGNEYRFLKSQIVAIFKKGGSNG